MATKLLAHGHIKDLANRTQQSNSNGQQANETFDDYIKRKTEENRAHKAALDALPKRMDTVEEKLASLEGRVANIEKMLKERLDKIEKMVK